jgi:hypothetical protein
VRLRFALPAALAALALAPGSALAVTVTEADDAAHPADQCTVDPAHCTLRDAVAVGGTVTFAPGVTTVTLASPLQIASNGIDIEGSVLVQPGTTFDPLIEFNTGTVGATVKGVSFTNPGGKAIAVDPGVTGVKVEQSPIFNAVTPISLGSGANGGIQPPQNLRVGPRQPDGSLPLSGTVAAGNRLDLYGGDPQGATPTTFLEAANVSPGSFSFPLSPEPAPGGKIAATVTGEDASHGTSQYAIADVPADLTSPTLKTAFAFSTNEVIVIPTEPLAQGSVSLSDFQLTMVGTPRALSQGGIAPDGSKVYLISSQPWNPGEAGSIAVSGPGAFTDLAGNYNTSAPTIPVGAAPGDLQGPLVTNLKLKPSKICLTKTRRCKHPGTTISFTTNERGKAIVMIARKSNRRAGQFVKKVLKAGKVTIKWAGTVHGRKLRAGTYLMEVSMQDAIGNVTADPPFKKFRILRTR